MKLDEVKHRSRTVVHFDPPNNNLARDGTNCEQVFHVRIIGIMGFGRLVARVRVRGSARARYPVPRPVSVHGRLFDPSRPCTIYMLEDLVNRERKSEI